MPLSYLEINSLNEISDYYVKIYDSDWNLLNSYTYNASNGYVMDGYLFGAENNSEISYSENGIVLNLKKCTKYI